MKRLITTLLVLMALSLTTAFAAGVVTGDKSEIDTSHTAEGYITVRMTRKTDKRIKVKTIYTQSDGTKIEYTYDLNGGGDAEVFSLQSGDGSYTVQVLENIDGSRYTVIQTATVRVKYAAENAPFLIPVQNVNYTDDSEAVQKAKELCGTAESELAEVEAVYRYIVEGIRYDYDKAKKVISGEITQYIPVVDDTMDSGEGICYDFSALMAAMLRSRGIPTKLVMGYVSEKQGVIYHAWNEVYITDVGWVKIRSSVYFDGDDWSRMDATFASGNRSGKKTSFIADDANYKKNKEY